jgi:hypothetical protein
MPASAVISILGVPGWGTLHLRLARGGDPAGLLQHLRRAWRQASPAGEGNPSAAVLLACLLRGPADLLPLGPDDWCCLQAPLLRHRLVCRRDRPVFEWRAWLQPSHSHPWQRCIGPRLLDASLLDASLLDASCQHEPSALQPVRSPPWIL